MFNELFLKFINYKLIINYLNNFLYYKNLKNSNFLIYWKLKYKTEIIQ